MCISGSGKDTIPLGHYHHFLPLPVFEHWSSCKWTWLEDYGLQLLVYCELLLSDSTLVCALANFSYFGFHQATHEYGHFSIAKKLVNFYFIVTTVLTLGLAMYLYECPVSLFDWHIKQHTEASCVLLANTSNLSYGSLPTPLTDLIDSHLLGSYQQSQQNRSWQCRILLGIIQAFMLAAWIPMSQEQICSPIQ